MKAFRPVLVFLALVSALPMIAAEPTPPPAPAVALAPAAPNSADLFAPLAGELPSWLQPEPELGGLAMSTELVPGQGCSVQACNRKCLWCQVACDGYCLVFGGICQCA